MMDLITKARTFAIAAHAHQKRKYDGLPYWVHLRDVAVIVREEGYMPSMQAAAWLHDTLEDTMITPEYLEREFGGDITELVVGLTDISKPSDGNRQMRKAVDREHLTRGNPWVQTIKCADLIVNTRDIAFSDHPDAISFAPVYLAEKRLLLGVMDKAHYELRRRAYRALNQAETYLRFGPERKMVNEH